MTTDNIVSTLFKELDIVDSLEARQSLAELLADKLSKDAETSLNR